MKSGKNITYIYIKSVWRSYRLNTTREISWEKNTRSNLNVHNVTLKSKVSYVMIWNYVYCRLEEKPRIHLRTLIKKMLHEAFIAYEFFVLGYCDIIVYLYKTVKYFTLSMALNISYAYSVFEQLWRFSKSSQALLFIAC